MQEIRALQTSALQVPEKIEEEYKIARFSNTSLFLISDTINCYLLIVL